MKNIPENLKIGLVLGGGGARGLAHIGVLNVLEAAGIPIHSIGGTSIGALVGAVYAQNPSAEVVHQKISDFVKGPKFVKLGVDNFREKKSRDPDDVLSQMAHRIKRRLIINLAANRMALLKSERLRIAIEDLVTDGLFEETQIPFVCVAADLISGEEVVFNQGKIRPAVEGSAAIPGFIPPVRYNGKMLIDGSTVNNFPVEQVRQLGANFIILVEVSLDFEENIEVDNVIDLVMRGNQITQRKLNAILRQAADVVIKPEIGDVHWSEFSRIDELIRQGEIAARATLPVIEESLMTRFKFWSKVRNILKV